MQRDAPRVLCLYFPATHFSDLTRWVFNGVQGYPLRITPGARSLIQFIVEETLLWVIKSTCIAVTELTPRKTMSAKDMSVVVRILSQRDSILSASLPEYEGLDALEEELLHSRSRASAASSGAARGRSSSGRRGRGQGRDRGRSRAETHDAESSDSD